ncbi:hypothetical protein OH76DRAFT_230785 [Lentinus brumalis]|uniref:Uncharacterized protein n=1 Tax=Lentinus brumalis TaxID=2498619 RepID=A0A371DHD0_9APHY|nr:hypothetical protein OH76DRAFT_230785 [Polyporus brumalis]
MPWIATCSELLVGILRSSSRTHTQRWPSTRLLYISLSRCSLLRNISSVLWRAESSFLLYTDMMVSQIPLRNYVFPWTQSDPCT